MKILILISRVFVSILFIISGLIKANDTIGFSYKLNEYFEVFSLTFFSEFSVLIAAIICVLEIVLGVMLLLGNRLRFVSWSLLLMIIFFTFLTLYSAYFNKVTDCGCFGDAIKLTPWQSFWKDIFLLILILVIFYHQEKIKPIFVHKKSDVISILSVLLSISFVIYTYNYLPLKDFRPYAIGKSIVEGMKDCYELNLPCPEQSAIYIVKNKKNGELSKMSAKDWSAQLNEFDFVEATDDNVIISKGYERLISDFSIQLNNYDITDSILNENKVFLIVSHDIEKANSNAFEFINDFYNLCIEKKHTIIMLSGSSSEILEKFSSNLNYQFSYAFTDETVLKTMIRSNPGIIELESGTVRNKWHYNKFNQIKSLYFD